MPRHTTAKGRTNVELREQFILAEGVSQSMAPFKSKPSPNSSVSSQSGTAQQRSQSLPGSGPIIKVCDLSAFICHHYKKNYIICNFYIIFQIHKKKMHKVLS